MTSSCLYEIRLLIQHSHDERFCARGLLGGSVSGTHLYPRELLPSHLRQMSIAFEEVEEPVELKALSTNITYISDTVTVGNSLQWFSNCLVEKRFIPHRSTREILDSGAAPTVKAGQLIDCVRVRLQNAQPERRRALYDSFVAIFSREEAYTDFVERLKHSVDNDCGAPKLGNLALSPPISATPGADFSQQHHLSQPLSLDPFAEITRTPRTFTEVKERVQSLERMFSDMHADAIFILQDVHRLNNINVCPPH